MKEPFFPKYDSGNRNTVGSGNPPKGFCGLYGEVLMQGSKKPETIPSARVLQAPTF